MSYHTDQYDKELAAQSRANRLKSLREMTGLSRNDFHKRYGIPRGTLQNWESARFGGLTQKGARNIIRAFNAEGIACDIDWLLYGTGASPKFNDHTPHQRNQELKKHTEVNEHIFEAETNIITKEILFFRQQHDNAIDIVVSDDAMQPKWFPGNYIAGVKHFQEDIVKTVGKYCIVQTQEYGNILRQVMPGDDPNLYNLLAINYQTKVKRPVLYNVGILSAAPVIWTRKIDILSY